MKNFLNNRRRVVTYLAVGAACFSVQFILLTLLVRLGAYRPVANSAAFGASAQLNFLLSSRLTWRDRPAHGWRSVGARWATYNGTALLSLGCDSAVFFLTYGTVGTLAGAVLGVLSATCLTYLLCNTVIFRARLARERGAVPAAAKLQDEVTR
jgi:putative flippase GtrA